MSKQFLVTLRSLLIQVINAIDDELGIPRTIPNKSERRVLKKAA